MRHIIIALLIVACVLTVMIVFCVLNAADYRDEWDEHYMEQEYDKGNKL